MRQSETKQVTTSMPKVLVQKVLKMWHAVQNEMLAQAAGMVDI